MDNRTDNAVYITWNFGIVTNPLINNDIVVVLRYRGVLLDTDLQQLNFSGASFLTNFEVARSAVNVSIVVPFLIPEVAIMVSMCNL